VALSVVECQIPHVEGAWDGTTNVIKSSIYFFAMLNIFVQAFIYLRAINRILYVRRSSDGKSEGSNDAYLAMKRYFLGMCITCSSAMIFKLNNMATNWGKTMYLRPPCKAEYISVVGTIFFISQITLLYTQHKAYTNIMKKERERKSGNGGRLIGSNQADNKLGRDIMAGRGSSLNSKPIAFVKKEAEGVRPSEELRDELARPSSGDENCGHSYLPKRHTSSVTTSTILIPNPNPFCDSLRSSQVSAPLLRTLREERAEEKHVAFVASSPSVMGEPTLQQMSGGGGRKEPLYAKEQTVRVASGDVEEGGSGSERGSWVWERSVSGRSGVGSIDLELEGEGEGGGGGNGGEEGNYAA